MLDEKNSSIITRKKDGDYLPETLDEPAYEVGLEKGEWVIKEIKTFTKSLRNDDSYSFHDTDIIRIISGGGGDAHGYGD